LNSVTDGAAIPNVGERGFTNLAGGEKQRVRCIAALSLKRPTIMVF